MKYTVTMPLVIFLAVMLGVSNLLDTSLPIAVSVGIFSAAATFFLRNKNTILGIGMSVVTLLSLVIVQFDQRALLLVAGFAGTMMAAIMAFAQKRDKRFSRNAANDEDAETIGDVIGGSPSDIPDECRVRGVWEWIHFEWKDIRKIFGATGDGLQAVDVILHNGRLIVVSKSVSTWKEALDLPIDPVTPIESNVALDNVESIELNSVAEFFAQKERQDHVCLLGKKRCKQRHPALTYERGGHWYNNKTEAVVFAFTNEGDRVRLFRTFNRDLAVKWRTQLGNRLDHWKSRNTGQGRSAVSGSASEYL